jgi:hypothetical protein
MSGSVGCRSKVMVVLSVPSCEAVRRSPSAGSVCHDFADPSSAARRYAGRVAVAVTAEGRVKHSDQTSYTILVSVQTSRG